MTLPPPPDPGAPDPAGRDPLAPDPLAPDPSALPSPGAPVLSGGETAKWIVLGVVAFFGVPLVGFATGGVGFLVGVAGLGYAGVQAWRKGEPSRARVRRFLVGLGIGFVIFGGCFVIVMSNMGSGGFH